MLFFLMVTGHRRSLVLGPTNKHTATGLAYGIFCLAENLIKVTFCSLPSSQSIVQIIRGKPELLCHGRGWCMRYGFWSYGSPCAEFDKWSFLKLRGSVVKMEKNTLSLQ